jgi:hypothetical protein
MGGCGEGARSKPTSWCSREREGEREREREGERERERNKERERVELPRARLRRVATPRTARREAEPGSHAALASHLTAVGLGTHACCCGRGREEGERHAPCEACSPTAAPPRPSPPPARRCRTGSLPPCGPAGTPSGANVPPAFVSTYTALVSQPGLGVGWVHWRAGNPDRLEPNPAAGKVRRGRDPPGFR